MATTEATVEVLTAEVRALMVGSRQITLSVFRQLDWVTWDDILPMGRVNDNRDADYQDRLLVGRDRGNGSLVRCNLNRVTDPRGWAQSAGGRDLQRRAIVGYKNVNTYADYLRALSLEPSSIHGSSLWADYENLALAHANEVVAREIEELTDNWNTYWACRRVYDALPLIVLAGLK